MPDPFAERDELDAVLDVAPTLARGYLSRIGDEPVLNPDVEAAIGRWSDPMPEEGVGAMSALTELGERAREAATRSSGPRFFHFVMDGDTPAALGADWRRVDICIRVRFRRWECSALVEVTSDGSRGTT